jgi:hypothetical protein
MLKKIIDILININYFVFLINKLSELSFKIISLKKYAEYKKSGAIENVKNYIKKKTVKFGPFKGLNYDGITSNCSAIYPKLVGSYEHELHGVIKNIISEKYKRIIDIGSAEGYYAVGIPFAMKDSNVEIIAIDTSKIAKINLIRLAKNNISNHVTICSNFDFKLLKDKKKTLVILDCEGAELNYLKKIKKKYILQWDFLIEVHVQIKKNIIKDLEKLFSKRKIQKIKSVDDYHKIEDLIDFFPKKFDDDTRLLLLSENRRSGMYWLFVK